MREKIWCFGQFDYGRAAQIHGKYLWIFHRQHIFFGAIASQFAHLGFNFWLEIPSPFFFGKPCSSIFHSKREILGGMPADIIQRWRLEASQKNHKLNFYECFGWFSTSPSHSSLLLFISFEAVTSARSTRLRFNRVWVRNHKIVFFLSAQLCVMHTMTFKTFNFFLLFHAWKFFFDPVRNWLWSASSLTWFWQLFWPTPVMRLKTSDFFSHREAFTLVCNFFQWVCYQTSCMRSERTNNRK